MDKDISTLVTTDVNDIIADLNNNLINVNGLGLYNGLMGMCICYFITSRITDEKKYEKRAKKLLSQIQQSIGTVDDLGFSAGLAGIGWGVEWLVRNKFVNANTDSILEELDDAIYASVVFSKDVYLSLGEGSIGKAMYYLARFQARNPNRNRYKHICNLECLVLLSDEISEKVLDENVGLIVKDPIKIVDQELQDIAQSLILMLRLNEKKINTQIVVETFRAIIFFVEKYILLIGNGGITLNEGRGFLHLIYAYILAGGILGKESFTEYSPVVHRYLVKMGYTSDTIIDLNISENVNSMNEENTLPLASQSNLFLKMLKNINSINNTNYCYEAFMFK